MRPMPDPANESIDRREATFVREEGTVPVVEPVVPAAVVSPVASATPVAGVREHVSVDYAAERAVTLNRVNGFIWFIFGLIAVLIGLRVVLRLLAANPASPFAQFIYGVTAPLVAPFNGLTVTPTMEGAALELSSIVALVVYLLLAWGLTRLMRLIFARPATRELSTTNYRRDM
jgi:uncharacterized protein YggT (Ycf19 family)